MALTNSDYAKILDAVAPDDTGDGGDPTGGKKTPVKKTVVATPNATATITTTDRGAGVDVPTTPNYTDTDDPNVKIGRYGLRITKDDMDSANKNGMGWTNFSNFADWMGGWAHKVPDFKSVSPVYRTYPTGTIPGGDIAIVMARNDPQMNQILSRNIARPGEVPMFGAEDADIIRAYIARMKKPALDQVYSNLAK